MKKSMALLGGVASVIGLIGVWTATSSAHRGHTLQSIEGRWGFNEESFAAGTPGYAAGIFTFHGDGTCTVFFAELGGGSPTGTDWTDPTECTYTIDSDGKGTITGGIAPVRFVVTEHGTLIRYVLCCERGFAGRGEMNRM